MINTLKADFQAYSKPVMVVVESNNDDGVSTIEDDTNSILVDFSDTLGYSSRSSLAPTPGPHDLHQKSLNEQEQHEREMQRHQEQNFQYIQSLLREIEHLKAELDRFSVEVTGS